MELAPGGILAWIMIGLIAGWSAGSVSREQGQGIVGDIVVGLVGAMAGGFLAAFYVRGTVGVFGSILMAFVGAVILLALWRAIRGRSVA